MSKHVVFEEGLQPMIPADTLVWDSPWQKPLFNNIDDLEWIHMECKR